MSASRQPPASPDVVPDVVSISAYTLVPEGIMSEVADVPKPVVHRKPNSIPFWSSSTSDAVDASTM